MYRGTLRNATAPSIVAISTCNGVNGIVQTQDDVLVIEPGVDVHSGYSIEAAPIIILEYFRDSASLEDEHVVYRLSDLNMPDASCGVKDHAEERHVSSIIEIICSYYLS